MPNATGGFPYRRTTLASLAALAALALAACGGADRASRGGAAAADTGGTPESGGTAVIAELADISHPMPLVAESQLDGDVGGDVMFLSLSRSAWRDGALVFLNSTQNPGALARGWELVGADSAALRYHLDAGRKWSDGQPITSADVVWTYQQLKNPEVASPQQDYANQMDSVIADNDSTVTFWFKRRYPDMLFHSGLGISPRHVFAGSDPAQIRTHPAFVDPVHRMVVSGPFRIGEWVKNDHFTLVPNPYFPVKPRLDRIVYRVIPEATTRLTELMNGTIDFMRPVPYDQVDRLRRQAPNVRLEREAGRSYDYIGYNPRAFAPFADPDIRRALGMAIDVPALMRALQIDRYAVPAGGPYSPLFRELYDPRGTPPLAYDTAGARKVLESKGWTDHNGDGIRDKDGVPFSFKVATNAGNSRRIDVAQIVQQQWKQLGVDAQIQMVESNTFFNELTKKNFQATVSGWSIGLSADLTTLWGRGSPFNFVSYDDPQTFALFTQAQAAARPAEADSLWRAAASRIAAAQPYTFLYWNDQLDGVSNRLRGIKVDTYGAYQNTWEWWIPKSMQRAVGGGAAPAAATSRG